MKKFLKKHTFLLLCFLAAALYLLFCSKSSPLYPMNDWVDVNCFYTMGKSLLAGQVPYRDLYEQKGPVLYFIYAVIALLSPGSYFGVYLLEVLTYGLFLYFGGLILRLYLKDTPIVWFLILGLGALIPCAGSFSHGASVEEMCLFMSAYGFYVTLRALRENRTLSFREALICGVWAGFLLWIKYTMLGLYLGLAIFIVIWYLGWGFRWRELLQTIGAFFAGIGTVSAVVFLYFLAEGALGDLFTVYFHNNIFLYAKEPEQSRILTIITCLKNTLKYNRIYSVFLIPGAIWGLVQGLRDVRIPLLLVLTFCGLALGTYWGGWGISYYGLVFSVFALFGILALGELAQLCRIHRLFVGSSGKRAVSLVLALMILCTMGFYCFRKSSNTYLMAFEKEDLPQYRFAEIIRQTPNATLLNFGFLDGGFYYAADIVPHNRFFCILNVAAPDMWQSMYRQVNQGLSDYIVTRDRELGSYQVDDSLYTCVDIAELYFEGKTRVYYLYRLNSIA